MHIEIDQSGKIEQWDYNYTPNFLTKSEVEYTFTFDCCLCLFSSDHSSKSLDVNVKAKYGASFVWDGNISRASGRCLEYSDSGAVSIFLNNKFVTNSSSAFVKPEYFSNLSSRFLISFSTNSGEYSLIPVLDKRFINFNMNPLLINAWNIMFASTTSIMLENQDTPCLLVTADFTSPANLNACSLVNLLFDTILSAKENSTSSINSFTTLFSAISKSCFNSGAISTLTTTSDILTSPSYNNEKDYLNLLIKSNKTGNVGIGTSSPTKELHVIGNANISNTIFVGGNLTFGNTSDYAEMFESDVELEHADVVCFDEFKKIDKCTKRADPLVIGVVSTNPSIIGRTGFEKSYPVGLTGVVPTKVIGPVDRGSMLTTSNKVGYAERATIADFGAIIGKAMEECYKDECVIDVVVNLQ